MNSNLANILIVDDEPLIRNIIREYLNGMGYGTVEASDGIQAWSILQQSSHKFNAIILDRNMPNMDGLEVLKKIKSDSKLNNIPVIMQTGSTKKHEILEGLQAGCYYYLNKPFQKDVFVSIVKTAVSDHLNYQLLQEELKKQGESLMLLDSGSFSFHTLEESRVLTKLLAAACPEPDKVATGLSEILINSVEHGNLEISYAEKSNLLENQQWQQEIEYRLQQEKYASRYVSVQFIRNANEINIEITDQGKGFEWQQYLEVSPERSSHSHGRGIAMANLFSFDSIEYKGNGNSVKITIITAPASKDKGLA